MPRRYKLRLSDGTVLLVDQHGLNTWRVDDKAMVQAGGGRWRPLKDILAMQQAAAKYAAQQESSPAVALPLVPPPAREDPSPRAPAAPSSVDLLEAAIAGDAAGVQALAEEPTRPLAEDEAPPILDTFSPAEPPGISLSEPPALQAWADEPPIPSMDSYSSPPDEDAAMIPSLPLPDEAPELSEPASWRDAVEPSPITAQPSLQVLADDPEPRYEYEDTPPTRDDGMPALSLKPPDDRDEAYAPAATGPGTHDREPDDFFERRPRGIVLDERFVRAASAFGGFLSWSLDHLESWYRRLQPEFRNAWATWRAARSRPRAPEEPQLVVEAPPAVQVLAGAPTGPRGEDAWPTVVAGEELPIIPLKPVEGEGASLRAVPKLVRRLGRWASASAAGLKGRIDRLARRYRPGPSPPSNEPAVSSAAYLPPPEPLKPPPSTSELPVLRLAEIHEPEEEEDLYEGGGESLFGAAWLWTKRVVWVTGLVAVGSLAALTWEAWFPKAAHVGGVGFTEMNKYMESRQQKERERQALLEATEQLPHLAPDTIRHVLSRSPTGVLDPPEVFQAACDAADRGGSALTPEEAQELKELRSTLLDTLSPAQRERIREYDEVRARRPPFAFEDRSALELFARGARALPSDSRERLQALVGKAIAAGLGPPMAVAPGAGAKR